MPLPISSFFSELAKIANGDLMTPAVVSDSAVVQGPPATPFTRRKGYRKLEQQQTVKEAAWERDLQAWALKRQRTARQAVSKLTDAQRLAYTKLPSPMQRAITDPSIMDPSDLRGGIALNTAKSLFKVGSANLT